MSSSMFDKVEQIFFIAQGLAESKFLPKFGPIRYQQLKLFEQVSTVETADAWSKITVDTGFQNPFGSYCEIDA